MCNEKSLQFAFSLRPTPPGNHLLKSLDSVSEELYPLDIYFCRNCNHVQLGHSVNPEILYQRNYTYVSSTSPIFVEHLRNFANTMSHKFHLKGKFVIDIGSNDGTCLSFFKESGSQVLGIDPSKEVSGIALENNVETINDFFGLELAKKIKTKYGKAKFITSHNACAHIDNLFDVIQGAEHLLKKDGVLCIEVGYFLDVYENIWFDTIYHEHLDYHTVAPFEKLFDRANLSLFDVQRIAPQGGSIRLLAQKSDGPYEKLPSVQKLIDNERARGLSDINTVKKFETRIKEVKLKLREILVDIKKSGKTIAGYGAPTKATTLMQYFEIDRNLLDFVVDDNPLKQDMYTPISHLKIYKPEVIYSKKPDFVLILAWNFSDSIIRKHKKYSDEIGSFIVPMPVPKIVDLK